MFVRESDMAAVVANWMKSSGLAAVKSEFVTPWGICDLVGLTFNRKKELRRLQQKQTRAITSITRAVLLIQIPDVEEGGWTTLARLVRQFAPSLPEDVVSEQIDRLIAGGFVVAHSRGRLQKVNGWMPLQDRLVAVELKLSRVAEAMRQALNHLGFAEESYVGLPANVARRVASSAFRWSDFFEAGVGLLSVTQRGCKVLVRSLPNRKWIDDAIQLYCVEKFWPPHIKGN
jgi:hypothetical protein